MDKPLLIFDGDCGFCRRWVERSRKLTGESVRYAPSDEAAKDFPDIPLKEFQKAVQLIEPDGRRSSAAEAIFRTLVYADSGAWLWAYEKIPGFASLSELAYGIVAGHRPAFSRVTRWFWGNPAEPSSYRLVRWAFLRALAVIYVIAFWSFGAQVKGLIGSQGILSAHDSLSRLATYGIARFWYVPTLAWLNSNDTFLVGLCAAGVIFSILILLNVVPRFSLFAAWLLYLSLVSVGGDFMNFQWDALLLETGFLAIFFAPSGFLPQRNGARSPAPALVFLLRWLLFRLMFQSALVKWLSGDPLWHHLMALTVHFQTQPLPNPLSWYADHLPLAVQKISCAGMFIIEGIIPLFIFAPRRLRIFAFWPLVGFQALILATGNYTFFNLLAIVLCLPLLDDAALRGRLPSWSDEPIAEAKNSCHPPRSSAGDPSRPLVAMMDPGLRIAGVTAIIFLTIIPFGHVVGIRWPAFIEMPEEILSPLRSFNSYGLFAVMTPTRPEIILEGSNDGKTWQPYEFKYKPGDLARRPKQVAPYQPRLDWQMWFAALGDYRQNPWFINLCVRILQGSEPVLGLLAKNPFPEHPPLFLRATVYDYRFTTPQEHYATGAWWSREDKGLYCPVMSLRGDMKPSRNIQ